MEGSESEAVFEELNINPQLFINDVLNSVDLLVDGAFDFFRQEAATILRTEGTDRSDDLNKGVGYLHGMIQETLDKQLGIWEKFCIRHCFSVPEGFTFPKTDESSGDTSVHLDSHHDTELDNQLDSLRKKLAAVGKESAELNKELQVLEKQTVLSKTYADSVNEALQLYQQNLTEEMFQEIISTASELRKRMETLKRKKTEDTGRTITERVIGTRDWRTINLSEGLSKAELKELQEFTAGIKNS